MKNKWSLFAGLILLTSGILLKLIFENSGFPVILIIVGILLKILFIINKIGRTNYKPGYEVIFLVTGLALFFLGVYMKSSFLFVEPVYLKIVGILLKITFIILFIRKTRV